MIDEEVVKIVRKAQSKADEILKNNIDQLHNLAKALLKYETIDGDEVISLMEGKKISRSTNGSLKKKNPSTKNKKQDPAKT